MQKQYDPCLGEGTILAPIEANGNALLMDLISIMKFFDRSCFADMRLLNSEDTRIVGGVIFFSL